MKRKKILVTGGSGFIGTNLIEELSFNNYDILNLDIQKPKIYEHTVNWKYCDINDYINLSNLINQFEPELVVHLAAVTDLNESKNISYYDTNIGGVKNLIKSLEKVNSLERVIFTSSMFVCKNGYNPKSDLDYCPDTLYGESKVKTEEIIREKSSSFNYKWCIIRPTSIWGPWFDVPYLNFFNILLNGNYFHPGNKSCTKTYGYVSNTVYQIISLLNARSHDFSNKTYYLGDYPPTNIEEWANEIGQSVGIRIKKAPYFLFKLLALIGDMLNIIGISFPMTAFRLRNMTTDNEKNVASIHKIAPNIPYTRKEGIDKTIKWIDNYK